MRPGPLDAGRLLEQDHAIQVIAQLPDEVKSWVLRVTRTLMTASPSLIVLAGWHIEGHASFKLRVARQRVKVPPYVAETCAAAPSHGRRQKMEQDAPARQSSHTTREGVQIRSSLLTRSM